MRTATAVLFSLAALLSTIAADAAPPEAGPIAVSPGMPDRFAPVASRCPTFAWTDAGGGEAIELLVYAIGERVEGQDKELEAPALRVLLPGAATAWTPSLDNCLEAGRRYSWLIRHEAANGGDRRFSEPRLFEVPATPTPADVRRALRVLSEYLATSGGAKPAAALETTRSRSSAPTPDASLTPTLNALESFTSALSVEQPANSGTAHGVVGITNSADGAGLVADNTAAGADLLLGAAIAAEAARVTEESFERQSAGDLAFDFRNTGAGSMSVRVDSTDVLTTATGAAAAHQHAGEDVSSGTVAEPRLDAAIARDGEIVPTVLANDGAGSTLDADLLDGNEASAFAPAAGSASYVAKGGDTMTGALNLPADGLAVGAGQLVASGGRVGIGTATPSGGVLHLSSTGSQLYIEDNDTPERNVAQLFMQGDLVRLIANHFLAGTPSIGISLETRNAGNPLEAMRLAPDGKVGLGTSAPSHPLHLKKFLNGAHLIASIENTGPFSAAALQLKTPAAGNEWALAAQETGGGAARGLEVQHAGFAVPPLAIDATTGFVGLGKLSPTEKLEVTGNAKATKFIGDGSMLTAIDADTVDGIDSSAFVAKPGDTMTGTLTLSPGAGDALVTTAGGVGIGTPTPGKPLHVVGQGAVFNTTAVGAPTTQPFLSIETDLYSATAGILSVLDRRQQTALSRTPTLLVQNTHGATLAVNPLLEARAAGVTRLMLQQDGNFGLHTASPSHPFHLKRFLNGAHLIASIENTGPFSAAALQLKTPAAGNEWALAAQETGAGAARGLEVQNPNFATPPFSIAASSGFVGINNLSPADRLDVKGDIRVGTGTTGCVKDADGTTIAGTCSSDVRLKRNIAPLTDMLDRVTRLTPVRFNWRSDEFPERALGDETQIGLIAQQVERVLPELVVEDEDGFQRVRYSELPLLLLQALNEQQQEADRLERRVRELAARLAELEKGRPSA